MGTQPESTPSTATYPSSIYQWETTDPVLGGVGGIANNPILALCNRTQYLKNRVDGQLVIGTNVQAWDADLDTIAALSGRGILERQGNNAWGLLGINPGIAGGRLTLASNTPVPTADVTAATTLYYTPYVHDQIAIYSTTETRWKLYTFSQLSFSLSGLLANTNYDAFVFDNAGSPTLQLVAWTSDTARSSSLTTLNGVWVKSSDSRRYVGTIRITAAGGQCEDSVVRRFVWNTGNQVSRSLFYSSAASWTYTTASARPINNDTAARFQIVNGIAQNLIIAAYRNNGLTSGRLQIYMGVNSTTTAAPTDTGFEGTFISGQNQLSLGPGTLIHAPSLGYSYYQMLENAFGISSSSVAGYSMSGAWTC